MELIRVDTDVLSPYVGKRTIVLPNGSGAMLFGGVVGFLYVEDGIAFMTVGIDAVAFGAFHEAATGDVPWQRYPHQEKLYHLSTTATVEDDGQLTFMPTIGGTCAHLWR